jgi:hypothetical protein
MNPYHHITRIDTGNTHGWMVRVRREGVRHHHFFSDGVHGSNQRALEEACIYRDELLVQLPPPMSPSDAGRLAGQTKTKSGVVGLHVAEREGRLYIKLMIQHEGERKTGSVRVDRLGPRRATWNACALLVKYRQQLGLEAAYANGTALVEQYFKQALPYVSKRYAAFLVEHESAVSGEG